MISFVRSLARRAHRSSDAHVPVLSVLDRNETTTDPRAYIELADTLDDHFDRDFLSHWFPRAVDEKTGGFHQDFGRDWSPTPPTERLAVHQARQTWLCSRAALHYPDRAAHFCEYARHGFDYLRGPMSDDEFGGPFFSLTGDGRPETYRGTEKSTYGAMFVILAAAAVHEATGDEQAREFALQVFDRLEVVVDIARH
jgi:mannobiose 2-epimerase